MKKLINISLFVLPFLGFSCSESPVHAQVPVEVSPFNAIEASSGVDVILRQGSTEKIKVQGSEKEIEGLVVETRGTVLHIYYDKKSDAWSLLSTGSQRSAKVYVQAVELNSIKASSGADVRGETVVRGSDFEIHASSGSDVTMEISVDRLSLSASSGSDIRLSGEVKDVFATSSSGSDINAVGLTALKAILKASSGSDLEMTVTDEVEAGASSGADIRVSGNPAKRQESASSSGDVLIK